MAPTVAHEFPGVLKRRYCDYVDRWGNCHYSSWGGWGRWVLAGSIVLLFFLVMLMLARKNSRARRARGQRPLYGTGFLAGPAPPYTPYPQGGSTNIAGGPPGPPGPPPPQYVYPENTGHKFNSNDGYYGSQGNSSNNNNGNYSASSPYGGQQSGIELQQPANTYQRGAVDDYAPPEGPPPSKRT
ncbi:protein RCR2 [Naviculisporaceae sp. PSN 640]